MGRVLLLPITELPANMSPFSVIKFVPLATASAAGLVRGLERLVSR